MAKGVKAMKKASSTKKVATSQVMRKPMKKSKVVNAAAKSRSLPKKQKEPWPEKIEKIAASLNTPPKIQAYIDSYPYDPSSEMRSVWQAFEDGKAHCFGGCLIAAYCLQRHGYGKAMVVQLDADPRLDDAHIIAAYKFNGLWGSIAKSNYNGIRGRDPVYGSLRELVMSYFDFYINKDGVKTLKGYSNAIVLDQVDPKREWVYDRSKPSGGYKVSVAAEPCPNKLLPKGFDKKKLLAQMQGKTLKGQLLGSNPKGLHGAH